MEMDPPVVAKSAGLRYVAERGAGIRRTRRGNRVSYRAPGGVRVAEHRERIAKLAIPPAWNDVWISPDPRAHLQATGLDARGRLQYRYHADWRLACDALKFRRIVTFANRLPRIRRTVSRDLERRGLPRTRVLAAIVRLLECSLIRVGNEEYARDNGSFGLTTLRKHHVRLNGAADVHFRFVGKSGIQHQIRLFAPRVAGVIRDCQGLPGRDLFQYEDGGEVRDITAADVNDYLSEHASAAVTAKDFRTWGATVLLHRALLKENSEGSPRAQARQLRRALQTVADALGNTVTVCRKSYVHPAVTRVYLDGGLKPVAWRPPVFGRRDLSALERATLHLLERAQQ